MTKEQKEEIFEKYCVHENHDIGNKDWMTKEKFFAALDELTDLSKLKKYKYGLYYKVSDVQKLLGGVA